MVLEPLTLYKLMILYMLNKVNFPLTVAQVSNFLLEKEYTTYFVFQQVMSELIESGLITSETLRNTTYLSITKNGIETAMLLSSNIPVAIIDDIDIFIAENKYDLRNEVGTTSDYYLTTNHDYMVHCLVKEGEQTLVELNMTVSTEEEAEDMCYNWRDASQSIYEHIMKSLMKPVHPHH